MGTHSIRPMLSPETAAGWPAVTALFAPKVALLTRRRPIDYCRVAAALCPPAPRLGRPA
jgi:hypothetical protein